ncbi:MAG: class I SAM-dependent methyltransferase [Candidatus Heimdallarchaeota archaeon]|nr:class I SAM-dependent methyltransferase [Candidatus Heimdallarchaeota archaeon]
MVKDINIYGDIFSKVYNLYWTEYIDEISPGVINFYKENLGKGVVLDLCCGTGRLCSILANKGISVIGIDQSEAMIKIAQTKTDLVEFIIDDARHFTLAEPVSMVISTFDSMNHMKSIEELDEVFQRVYEALIPGGWFLFDINLPKTLKTWDFVDVEETDDTTIIMYGKYIPAERRAYTRVTGFYLDQGCYKKFNEVMINTIFELDDIKASLSKIGFSKIEFYLPENLKKIVDTPKNEERIMIAAFK